MKEAIIDAIKHVLKLFGNALGKYLSDAANVKAEPASIYLTWIFDLRPIMNLPRMIKTRALSPEAICRSCSQARECPRKQSHIDNMLSDPVDDVDDEMIMKIMDRGTGPPEHPKQPEYVFDTGSALRCCDLVLSETQHYCMVLIAFIKMRLKRKTRISFPPALDKRNCSLQTQ